MQKAEAQHNHSQSQPTQRPGRGASLESLQGEQIAQLEAMVEASPQAGKLAQLAAMADNSAVMAAQCKAINAIQNSPNMTFQRQRLDSLAGQATQREEAEEPLQAKVAQREEVPAKPNNTGLPDNLKSGIESLSGMSMDNVKVHYNSSQPAQLNAHAYAQGTDIHVAPGQEQHLPHEAWHVVQQAQGRVKPTMQMKGDVPVNDDAGLEREADVMGARATSVGDVQRKSNGFNPIDRAPSVSAKSPVVQRVLLIGYNKYGSIRFDQIPYYERLVQKVKKKIEMWAVKKRDLPFTSWIDVVDTALRITGIARANMYEKRDFNTHLDNMVEPRHVVKAGRKYWSGSVPTFVFGGQYYNSNDARFKKIYGGREVHATLDNVDEVNIRNELVEYVKAQPAWINRNQHAALYTDGVNLQGWTVEGACVGTWHISLYVADTHVGGWYAIDGNASLPVYQNDAGAATVADTQQAVTIHGNMNNQIL